tara:strand:+ start:197 stop:1111 length:915 start_codon:yes stop_codon:yes gene_type:complete
MAFLDNSGDIILDAVLTDTGRMRLARGDGSFKIAKFAFADDEIDYGNYNKNHSSGSAYFDLEIMQTPVLEAFTNNTSSMKSKLISISRTNLLYLPVIQLNQIFSGTSTKMHADGYFLVAVDEDTEKELVGTLDGSQGAARPSEDGSHIRLDQGLDTTEISPSNLLDADLTETQYIVELDNRFASLVDKAGSTMASVSFVDDDHIASYYLSLGTDNLFVETNTVTDAATGTQVISGPRGTNIMFKFQASVDLNSSTFLFSELGSEVSYTGASGAATYLFIDSIVRVTGATTGYKIDVPVRFVKKK